MALNKIETISKPIKAIDLSRLKVNGKKHDELTFVEPPPNIVSIAETNVTRNTGKSKVKRIYGVQDIEIEEGGSWCSICGDGPWKTAVRHNSSGSPRPIIRLKLKKEEMWICYECIGYMKKSLIGCRATNDNRSNLRRLAKARLRANQGTEGAWRRGSGTHTIYPEDTSEVVTVYDNQKVVRKYLTRKQVEKKYEQKRLAREAREETRRDRKRKRDCIRGYSIIEGQYFPIFGDSKYDHLLPQNRKKKKEAHKMPMEIMNKVK